MTEQRTRARADAIAKKSGHTDNTTYEALRTALPAPVEFLGYTESSARATVLGMLVDGVSATLAVAPAEVEIILDRTPFYAEAGGQLADQGVILLDGGARVEIADVQAPIKGMNVHRGHLVDGTITLGESGVAEIDVARRGAIARAHTATHLIHKALQETLGKDSTQAGSENAPSRVRFDFRRGQDWSRELCAGTHVASSGELGLVTLLGEASIGSGVRRVDALVGAGAYGYQAKERALVSQLSGLLNARGEEMPERIASLLTRLKDAEKELSQMRQAQLLAVAGKLAAEAKDVAGVRVVTHDAGEVSGADDLRALVLDVRGRLGDSTPATIAVAGHHAGRPLVVIATNASAREAGVRAGALAKAASTALGGGGGGKDDLAQGGGTKVDQIGAALDGVHTGIATSQGRA